MDRDCFKLVRRYYTVQQPRSQFVEVTRPRRRYDANFSPLNTNPGAIDILKKYYKQNGFINNEPGAGIGVLDIMIYQNPAAKPLLEAEYQTVFQLKEIRELVHDNKDVKLTEEEQQILDAGEDLQIDEHIEWRELMFSMKSIKFLKKALMDKLLNRIEWRYLMYNKHMGELVRLNLRNMIMDHTTIENFTDDIKEYEKKYDGRIVVDQAIFHPFADNPGFINMIQRELTYHDCNTDLRFGSTYDGLTDDVALSRNEKAAHIHRMRLIKPSAEYTVSFLDWSPVLIDILLPDKSKREQVLRENPLLKTFIDKLDYKYGKAVEYMDDTDDRKPHYLSVNPNVLTLFTKKSYAWNDFSDREHREILKNRIIFRRWSL